MQQDPPGEQGIAVSGDAEHTTSQTFSINPSASGLSCIPIRAFPGFWQAVVLLLAVGFVQSLLAIASIVFGMGRHPAMVNSISSLIVTALIIVYAPGKTRARFSQVFPFTGVRPSILLGAGLAAIGMHILLTDAARLVLWILPPPKILTQILRSNVDRSGAVRWEWIVAVALVAPFTEEILFRGLILYGFLKRYGAGKAIWASTLLFALMHGNPWQIPVAVCSGVFLAWLFVKTRSLIPCFVAHATNNSAGFLHSAAFSAPPSYASSARELVFQPLWLNAVGALLVIVGIYFLIRSLERNQIPTQAT